jgi:hypothetical protein
MPESSTKNHPSLAELLLDRMGVDRTGVRQSEARELMLHVLDSESEPLPNDTASQPPTADPTAAEPDVPEPGPGEPMFIADPQKVADFKRTLRARRSPRCRHRKVNGIRCGSPALGGGSYCYFHHSIYTGDTQHLPIVEDGNSIAFIIGMIVRELASGRLEVRRANSMLYALQSTAALLKYLDFEPDPALLEQDDDDEDEPPDSPPPSGLTAFAEGANRKA